MKKTYSIFILVFLFLIFLIITSGCSTITGINWCMNEYYYIHYPMIESEGNNTINNIVISTSTFGTNSTRLIKIVEIIADNDNFTDMYWPDQTNDRFFCYVTYSNGKSEWTWCPPFGGIFGSDSTNYSYVFDKRGGVKTRLSNDLNYDPKWIAYQRTGACESLSILFNETANRSGVVSRIVSSESASHTWNEVLINGEWKYYDVQRYGQVRNTSESSFWFGNRSEFGYKSGFSYSQLIEKGVYVFDIQNHTQSPEEITKDYEVQL